MKYTVISVIDGDTFTVSPNWYWNGNTGDTVRPNGYDAPEKGEPGYEEAKRKLENLIKGKQVTLGEGIKLTYGRLLCDVFYNGKNLKDYFLEYQ